MIRYAFFPFHHSQRRRPRLSLLLCILLLAGGALFWFYMPIDAQPGANCSASFLVDRTLSNGARWQLCWEHRALDGIVFRDVYFTPPGGEGRRILSQGSIAQVHVPYDDNSARFHDITDDGFGGNNLNDLTPAECPGGVLLKLGAKNALCQQIQNRSYAFKGLGTQAQSEMLSLFSVSTSGEYNYIPVWRFADDGTIDLLMGAAGKLQRYTNDSRYGWPVRANNLRGTSHIHNYYWRLDFDLSASGEDDVVEEINYVPSADNSRRTLGLTRLTTEAGRSIDPTGLRSWRIRDGSTTNANGQPVSYQLEPIDISHRDVGPDFEPWTANDFYVTRYRECERYASHNPQLNGCADNLAAFVNGESLEGADVVLWYGITFHHIARDEDEPYMHAHWSGFSLTPRDWLDANPAAAALATCAVGDVTCDGQVDAADALYMLQHEVRLRPTSAQLPLPEGTLYGYSCDVSGEGACNAVDALFTLQCSVALANRFCPPAEGLQMAQPANAESTPVVITLGQSASDEVGSTRVPIALEAPTRVGALSATISYDPTWPGEVACVVDPDEHFDLKACTVDAAAGLVRFSLISTTGVVDSNTIGQVIFTMPAGSEARTPLPIFQSVLLATPDGVLAPFQTRYNRVTGQTYLPLIER
jgi:hypothetical protein